MTMDALPTVWKRSATSIFWGRILRSSRNCQQGDSWESTRQALRITIRSRPAILFVSALVPIFLPQNGTSPPGRRSPGLAALCGPFEPRRTDLRPNSLLGARLELFDSQRCSYICYRCLHSGPWIAASSRWKNRTQFGSPANRVRTRTSSPGRAPTGRMQRMTCFGGETAARLVTCSRTNPHIGPTSSMLRPSRPWARMKPASSAWEAYVPGLSSVTGTSSRPKSFAHSTAPTHPP